MKKCEECGESCKRRTQCVHCGLYVCKACFYPKHSCRPGHSRKTCKDHRENKKYGKEFLERIRARTLVKLAREKKGDAVPYANPGRDIK